MNIVEQASAVEQMANPQEEIDFRIFVPSRSLDTATQILNKFSEVSYERRDPNAQFTKYAFLCHAERYQAEAVSRALMMARIDAVSRFD